MTEEEIVNKTLVCTAASCYMPVKAPKYLRRQQTEVLDRFEDGETVEVSEDEVEAWLETGNFQVVG